jgi:hypothetical protein
MHVHAGFPLRHTTESVAPCLELGALSHQHSLSLELSSPASWTFSLQTLATALDYAVAMFGPYTNDSCKGEGYVAPPDKEPQDLLVQLVLSGVLGVSATITFCVCPCPAPDRKRRGC